MSTTAPIAPHSPSVVPPGAGRPLVPGVDPDETIFRLSVEQYQAMIRSGILTDDDPVELLEGLLVTKMAKNPAHALAACGPRPIADNGPDGPGGGRLTITATVNVGDLEVRR